MSTARGWAPIRARALPSKEKVFVVSNGERLVSDRVTVAEATLDDLAQLAFELGVHAVLMRDSSEWIGELLVEIEARRRILVCPQAEIDQRRRVLETALADADRALDRLVRALITIEGEVVLRFSKHRARVLAELKVKAQEELCAGMGGLAGRNYELRAYAMLLAREIAGWYIYDRKGRIQAVAVDLRREAANRFEVAVAPFYKSLAESAELGRIARYWEPAALNAEPNELLPELVSPGRWTFLASLVDFGRPRENARSAIARAAARYLDELIELNGRQIEQNFGTSLARSRARFEGSVRKGLKDVLTSAEQAFSAAIALRRLGNRAVDAEYLRLGRYRDRIRMLMHTTVSDPVVGTGA